MFLKHYAPNRCEPSIETLNFGGRGGGAGVRAGRSEVFCENSFFFWGGGVGLGVRVDVNGKVTFL